MVYWSDKMPKIKHLTFWVVFFACFFVQVIPVVRSGLSYSYGLGFWGANGHDSIWHLSLINHIRSPFKVPLPIFAGQNLGNYHPLFDILITYLSKVTFISTSVWLFQLFPVLSTILFLILSYQLGKKITTRSSGGIWLMFLNSFANSFGWIVSLFRNGSLSGESLFWSMQSPSNQINPPYTLSVIMLMMLILITLNKKQRPLDNLLIFIILVLIPITKAYAAIPAFLFFGLSSLKSALSKRYQPLILFITSTIAALIVFYYYNPHSSGLLIFKPFWFTNSMIESPDRFYFPYLANMRYALEDSGKIGPRLLAVHLISVAIFIVGNFSWRLIGLRNLKREHIRFLLPLIVCTLIPLLFIQNGTAWNTIQFLYYALFIGNILLVIFLDNSSSIFIKTAIPFSFILASIPGIQMYLGNPAPASLPYSEVKALEFLSKQPRGTVLTYPYDEFLKKHLSAPVPLYAYETTSYVAAFSKQPTFVDDYMNLDNSGFNYKSRLDDVKAFFAQESEFKDRGFLVNNQISYIYLTGEQIKKNTINTEKMYVTKIYDQPEVKIYKVQK